MSERMQRNQPVIEEFRANRGVVGGSWEGVPLLILTTVGARSGEPRTTPLTYLPDGERLVVFGANGGRTQHPGWYHNLRADPSARVEIGDDAFAARAVEAEGAERERLWERQLLVTPYFAGFQEKAERRIPVVVLARSDT